MAQADSTRQAGPLLPAPHTTTARAHPPRGAANVFPLPAARAPREHVEILVAAAASSPGLSVDDLRIKGALPRRDFAAAFAACRALGVLDVTHREDGRHSRARVYPGAGLHGAANRGAGPQRGEGRDAS